MIAEIIINRSAKRLNRTFDYNIPKELEELIMIGSTVIVPFGKSAEGKGTNLAEGYVVGIKENTTYEVKDIVKVETGVFGAKMKVSLINDGPTTIIMEK